MSIFVLSAGCTEEEVSLLREVAATDAETPLIHVVDDLTQGGATCYFVVSLVRDTTDT